MGATSHPVRIEIRPSGLWPRVPWADLWRHRELLCFLAWRDIKVRYKQAALGALWAILQPLAAMLIFTLVFGRLARMPSDGLPYAVFVYCALLPWTYFANALTNAGQSLVGSANLVTKVYFPRLFVPAASVMAGLLDLAIAFPILLVLMAYYGIAPAWSWLVAPLLALLGALMALGVGMWLAAINVKYRDVRYAVPFLIQLWMFATPVVYPSTLAPERFRWILHLNPMAGVVETYRAALLGTELPWGALLYALAVCVALLVTGMAYFHRVERTFADVI